jgi:hypothetical protein
VPGGSFTSRDGVVITSLPGEMNQPINVSAEPIQASRFRLPMPAGVEPVGQAFRIGATQTTFAAFDVAIPAPTRAPGEDIRLYVFTPIPFVRRPEDVKNGGSWYELTDEIDLQNRYHAHTGALAPEGFIYSFGKVLGSVRTTSVKASSDPLGSVACVGNLAKNNKKLCPIGKTTEALTTLNSVISSLKTDLNIPSAAFTYLTPPLRIADSTEGNCVLDATTTPIETAAAFYFFDVTAQQVTICYNLSDGKFSPYLTKILRHELFHAIQYYYWKIDEARIDYWIQSNRNESKLDAFDAQQTWMLEGTAAIMQLSSQTGLRTDYDYFFKARNITVPLSSDGKIESDIRLPYRTEDFWAYLGNQNNTGLNLVKHLLDQGKMSNSLTFADNAIKSLPGLPSPGGLKDAYWQWAKTQAYEWKNPYRSLNYPAKVQCVLDNML